MTTNKALGALVTLALLAGVVPAASAQDCSWLQNLEQGVVKTDGKIASAIIPAGVPNQTGTMLKMCLARIEGLGSDFSFGIPTNLFSSLLNQACQIGANQVNNVMNSYVDKNVSYPDLLNANVGAGQSGINYNVTNDSSSVASDIWNKALGPSY